MHRGRVIRKEHLKHTRHSNHLLDLHKCQVRIAHFANAGARTFADVSVLLTSTQAYDSLWRGAVSIQNTSALSKRRSGKWWILCYNKTLTNYHFKGGDVGSDFSWERHKWCIAASGLWGKVGRHYLIEGLLFHIKRCFVHEDVSLSDWFSLSFSAIFKGV